MTHFKRCDLRLF